MRPAKASHEQLPVSRSVQERKTPQDCDAAFGRPDMERVGVVHRSVADISQGNTQTQPEWMRLRYSHSALNPSPSSLTHEIPARSQIPALEPVADNAPELRRGLVHGALASERGRKWLDGRASFAARDLGAEPG